MIIDVFNHFYPKEYLDALLRPLPNVVTWISSDNPAAGGGGKSIIDSDYRMKEMKRFRIDKQRARRKNKKLRRSSTKRLSCWACISEIK